MDIQENYESSRCPKLLGQITSQSEGKFLTKKYPHMVSIKMVPIYETHSDFR